MKKAILFGANGYLGRHIALFLSDNNIEFIPTDIAETSIDNRSNYLKIDVTNLSDLQKLDYEVDYVFVFSGLTGTKNSSDIIEKFTQVNEQGLNNIIACCERIENVRIIFPSTRLVYKGIENTPLDEDSIKESKTIYAKNKLACEVMLVKSKVDYTIFRICVPYGNLIDKSYSYGTIGFFISKAINKENITLFGDGQLKRTFTHVSDISEIILKSITLQSTKNNIYNIGSNDARSLLEVANLVALKYDVEVDFIEWPIEALKVESGDTIFEDKKLQEVLNYNYKHSLKNWLTEI